MIEKRILIAEDEKSIAKALQLKLSSLYTTVNVAKNGEEALMMLAKDPYDVLLLDLMMPLKNGFDVLEALKTQKNKPVIIVSSNLSQEEDISKAKKLGATDYYVKSNTPIIEVVKKIATYLQ